MTTSSNTTVINCRFSYAYVFTPHAATEGQDKTYSCQLLVSKADNLSIGRLQDAIKAAYEAGADKLKGKGKVVPSMAEIHRPLRDGDKEHPGDPIYKGMLFFNAKNSRRPNIVDRNRQPILDEDEFYSGCYGRAQIQFYAYNTNGNRGIAASLQNVQKLKDGERLGGANPSADDAFGGDNEYADGSAFFDQESFVSSDDQSYLA